MKKLLFIALIFTTLSCCGVKESTEDNNKWKSDLQARIYVKDTTIVYLKRINLMYRDSLNNYNRDTTTWHIK